jgi:8-oxo-dGTP pyrophosphatase MutT (NUDIX family)
MLLQLKVNPTILRRALELAVVRRFRSLTIGAQAVVIDPQGRIFLVKHSYVAGWHLPGGGVEVGETVLEALERELLEEGGITATERPVLHGVYLNSRVSRRDHIFLYVIRAFRQEGGPRHPYEIIDHGFFAPEALPKDTSRATRARLAELFMGASISPRW